MLILRRVIKTPHVAESAFSMECELMHWYEIKNDAGESTNTVVLGRIRRFHVVRHLSLPMFPAGQSARAREKKTDEQNEYCFSGDELKLAPEQLNAIARLGGIRCVSLMPKAECPRCHIQRTGGNG